MIFCLAVIVTLGGFEVKAAAIDNSASAAIVYEANTETVLYEKNADIQMLIASTTKIMTALVVLENCDTAQQVLIKPEYAAVEGSSMYLESGERYSVLELLYGLMLASGNDAAVALACYTAGSIEKFAELMNEKALSFGCENTSFKNPNGLDEPGHYSCARDLAVITAQAMENSVFRSVVSTKSVSVAGRTYTNHNKLLWMYDGVIGVKTGYTMSAGRTLVSCAEHDGSRIICVTLSDGNDWEDHIAMFDWAFSNYKVYSFGAADYVYNVPVISGSLSYAEASLHEDCRFLARADDEVTAQVQLYRFFYAPVYKGERAGSVTVYLNGVEKVSAPIVFDETVYELRDSTHWWQFWE